MTDGNASAPTRETAAPLRAWLEANLVCPRDHGPLALLDGHLRCRSGHAYPLAGDIPVMLLGEAVPTHPNATLSLEAAAHPQPGWRPPPTTPGAEAAVHPWVQSIIGGTCGFLYVPLEGRLPRYPIPDIRLPPGPGLRLLDVGCNWGRWSISAARLGYDVVGIDTSLEAVQAAADVCRQLGVRAHFIVADARHLPFPDAAFDVVFSYSVLQHFSKEDAVRSLAAAARVLRPGGTALVQMPNAFGIRTMHQRLRRAFRPERVFDVRTWSLPELRRAFTSAVGPAQLEIDGFFSLNAQASDMDLLAWHHGMVVRSSEALRRLARHLPWLVWAADSILVRAVRSPANAS